MPVDFERAQTLLKKAIAAGDSNAGWAWSSLGDLYRTADEPHRDMAKAVDAYQHAVDLGDTASMIRLATIVGPGDGMPVDFERAQSLLEKAIAAGDGNAGWAWASLGDLYRNADEAHRDLAKAVDAYEHAADAGIGPAHLAAAQLESVNGFQPQVQRDLLVHHFREAARLLGVGAAVKAMYALQPVTLYGVVQEMLSEAGGRITSMVSSAVRRSSRSIVSAPKSRSTPAAKGLITTSLLQALLAPARRPPAGG